MRAYRTGALGRPHDVQGHWGAPLRQTVVAVHQAAPEASGWCRTRWSYATLALTLHAQVGVTVSAATVRRWLHTLGWGWQRAKRMAKENAPRRVERLAHLRWLFAPLQAWEALVVADALDIPLFPKVGAMWMPTGTPRTVMTPGQHAKQYLAGALDLATGQLWHCLGVRKTTALFRALLEAREQRYPTCARHGAQRRDWRWQPEGDSQPGSDSRVHVPWRP